MSLETKCSLLAGWAAVLLLCAAYVKAFAFGPVIFVISDRFGWGVHTGDLWTLVLIIPMIIITVVVLRSRKTSDS